MTVASNCYTGIDPGAKDTGVTTLIGPHALSAVVTRRPEWDDRAYIDIVFCEVELQQHTALGTVDGRALVGVEMVNPPHAWRDGKKVPINPGSLIGTAMIYGAVLWRFHATPIRPQGFGSGPREAYPADLWGSREGEAGTGRLRHARSAYDVAQALAGRWPPSGRKVGKRQGPPKGPLSGK